MFQIRVQKKQIVYIKRIKKKISCADQKRGSGNQTIFSCNIAVIFIPNDGEGKHIKAIDKNADEVMQ